MAASSFTTIYGFKAARDARGGELKHRRISPEAGRGLEILGHAIDYLTDEYCLLNGVYFNLADSRVQALLLLMERNREIYFACPEVPSFGERVRNWLRLKAA